MLAARKHDPRRIAANIAKLGVIAEAVIGGNGQYCSRVFTMANRKLASEAGRASGPASPFRTATGATRRRS
jgi:hypothetical protein